MRACYVAIAIAITALAACKSSSDSSPGRRVTLLSYNVGNPDDTDPDYPLRMSYQIYEDFIGARIREMWR